MRKVLSFVLVLSLVLGSFSMAFAANEAQASLSDIAGHANEEAITVNFNLKIIDGMGDGTFAPDQQVTRAQFAAMITRALAIPESALAGYKTTTFKDTTGYGWAVPYLAFCQSKGILVGDGAGNVMPGRTVSANEAVTMIMRAVGYTNNSAALVGVWPANYVSLAQNNNLYKDVAAAAGVTRANAAQIIYNALTVDKVEVSADGTTKVLSDRSNSNENKWTIVNMLTTGLDAYAEITTIMGDEDSLINLTPYIGKEVTAYKQNAKPHNILAIASEESTTITGEFASKITVDGGVIQNAPKFEGDDDVDYTINLKKDARDIAYVMLNGESLTGKTGSWGTGDRAIAITNGKYEIGSDVTVTVNAEVSGKTIKEIHTMTMWMEDGAKQVKKADLNQLADQRLLSYDFATLKDKSIDKTSFALLGVTSLDKIAENNIVYVYTKGADGKGDINKVEVGTTVVTGEITKIKGEKFTVDGKEYKFAKTKGAADPSKEDPKLEVGDDVIFYLDYAGKVYEAENKTGSNDKYAVLLPDTSVKNEYKFYTADDEDLWIDTKTDAKDVVKVAKAATATNYDAGTIDILGYSLNKSGAMSTADKDKNFTGTSSAYLESKTLLVVDGVKYSVKSDAVVFGIATVSSINADKGDITIATDINNVDTKKDAPNLGKVFVKLNSKGDQVVALIVDEKFTSKSDDDTYAVFDEVSRVLNADKDKVLQLKGFANGAKLDKLTNGDDLTFKTPAKPELYKLDVKSDGVVKGWTEKTISAGGANVTVTAIKNDGHTLTLSGGVKVALSDKAVVYRAVIDDGDVDYYALSDVDSIAEGNTIYLYETDDDEDGYDVAIIVTKW